MNDQLRLWLRGGQDREFRAHCPVDDSAMLIYLTQAGETVQKGVGTIDHEGDFKKRFAEALNDCINAINQRFTPTRSSGD